MLVLSRHVNERVVIVLPDGRRIYVTPLDIRSGFKIRLGFDAPKDIIVDREEVRREIDEREGR